MCIPQNQNAAGGKGSTPAPPPPMSAIARASDNAADVNKSTAPAANAATAGSNGAGVPTTNANAQFAFPANTPPAAQSPTTDTTNSAFAFPANVGASPAASPSGGTSGAAPAGPATSAAPGDSASNFETTHYGYADDPTPDDDTKAGNGKWGKLVGDDSLALSDSMASRIGAKPGDRIELTDKNGNTREGTYIDRAPEKNDRVDIYDPKGSEKKGTPFTAVSARKVGARKAVADQLYPNNPRT